MVVVPYAHPVLLTTDEAALLFQPAQQPADFAHYLAVRDPVRQPLLHDDGPVEDELIPAISPLANAYRVPNYAVVVDAKGQQLVAELLRRDEVGRRRVEGKERCAERGQRRRGRYAALGHLVEHAGACSHVSAGAGTG